MPRQVLLGLILVGVATSCGATAVRATPSMPTTTLPSNARCIDGVPGKDVPLVSVGVLTLDPQGVGEGALCDSLMSQGYVTSNPTGSVILYQFCRRDFMVPGYNTDLLATVRVFDTQASSVEHTMCTLLSQDRSTAAGPVPALFTDPPPSDG